MQPAGEKFSIIYKNQTVSVQPYLHAGRTLYQVAIPGGTIIITKAERISGKGFWTSVPQGKQKLAEEIGAILDSRPSDEPKQQTLF